MSFLEQPAFEIGRRVDIRGGNTWLVVVGPDSTDDLIAGFVADLSASLSRTVRVVKAAGSMDGLLTALESPADDPVLIADLDGVDAEAWSALDVNRSGLAREGAVILWLSSYGLANLSRFAPNLRSFVGGSIFPLSPDGSTLTPEERASRIAELEDHFRMTSEQAVAEALAGTQPPDPLFVEWLVLLDRGDLV
jgi:hypothetical protein